jgi:Zn-dependent M28 family amino/carboxypeptidase
MKGEEEVQPILGGPSSRARNARFWVLVVLGFAILTLLVVLIVLVATYPNIPPPPSPSPSPTPTPTPTPSPAPIPTPPSNNSLYNALNVQDIMTHLQMFQAIANASNGTRAANTVGYNVSAAYVESLLNATGFYNVTRNYFTIPAFDILTTPTLQETYPSNRSFIYQQDFVLVQFTRGGYVQAPVAAVPNLGCDPSDWANFPPNYIALVLRGNCTFATKISFAFASGAAMIIIYNNQPGLVSPAGLANVTIPMVFMTQDQGMALVDALSIGLNITLAFNVSTRVYSVPTFNVIADSLTGRPNATIVIGSHLDSVPAGPGINDNGSGSATDLQLALLIAKLNMTLNNRFRFAWWGAEELGLLGSTAYVQSIQGTPEIQNIALNLNFDMIGSPNFFRGVYNGSGASPNVINGSISIQNLFANYFQSNNITYAFTSFDGRSDYGPFISNGISAGGLFTGAEVIKSPSYRSLFGGIANAPYDPCYHQSCDTVENINVQVLDQLSHCIAAVLQRLAVDTALVDLIKAQMPPQSFI